MNLFCVCSECDCGSPNICHANACICCGSSKPTTSISNNLELQSSGQEGKP